MGGLIKTTTIIIKIIVLIIIVILTIQSLIAVAFRRPFVMADVEMALPKYQKI